MIINSGTRRAALYLPLVGLDIIAPEAADLVFKVHLCLHNVLGGPVKSWQVATNVVPKIVKVTYRQILGQHLTLRTWIKINAVR